VGIPPPSSTGAAAPRLEACPAGESGSDTRIPLLYPRSMWCLGQVARKRPGAKSFPYKITLISRERVKQEKKPWIGTNQWRHRALHTIRMKFWFQLEKAKRRAAFIWYKFYTVRGYGAPGRLEFICPVSGMVAKTIQQQEAISHRKYWIDCARKSQEILLWLDGVEVNRYNAKTHSFLLSLLVVKDPILREVKAYEKKTPFIASRPWQTTRAKNITNN